MIIHNLFPTPLGIFNFPRDFTQTELEFIENQEKKENLGNFNSLNSKILDETLLIELREFIENKVSEYFNNIYSPKNNTSLRITQSWCNYSQTKQYHHQHSHSNSFISGILYIQTNNDDKIYFHNDKFRQLTTPTDNYNTYNSESWWMEATAKTMYLFPSSLQHSVKPVDGELTRISLSFNTFPVGNFGDDQALTGLIL